MSIFWNNNAKFLSLYIRNIITARLRAVSFFIAAKTKNLIGETRFFIALA